MACERPVRVLDPLENAAIVLLVVQRAIALIGMDEDTPGKMAVRIAGDKADIAVFAAEGTGAFLHPHLAEGGVPDAFIIICLGGGAEEGAGGQDGLKHGFHHCPLCLDFLLGWVCARSLRDRRRVPLRPLHVSGMSCSAPVVAPVFNRYRARDGRT